MSATTLYRIAAVIFLLFATLHTVGFLSLKPPTPEALAVWDGMNRVHFSIDGTSYSYGKFYRGLGLSITVSMLFLTYLAWELGGLARTAPSAAAHAGWALCLSQLGGAAVALRYIGMPPAIFSTVVAAILAGAAWMSGRNSAAMRQAA